MIVGVQPHQRVSLSRSLLTVYCLCMQVAFDYIHMFTSSEICVIQAYAMSTKIFVICKILHHCRDSNPHMRSLAAACYVIESAALLASIDNIGVHVIHYLCFSHYHDERTIGGSHTNAIQPGVQVLLLEASIQPDHALNGLEKCSSRVQASGGLARRLIATAHAHDMLAQYGKCLILNDDG